MLDSFVKYPIEQSILKTLLYADLFSWPLRENEVFLKMQNSKLKIRKKEIKASISNLLKTQKIKAKEGFYFLPGKEKLVKQRWQKEKWAEKKIALAKKKAKWLKSIPFVLLVGVSGGLAIGNVSKDDDIDFFIICRKGSLWTTRFLVTVLFDFLGWRRRPGDKKVKDKICLNMFVDEAGMAVPKKERDLFTAHEVGQMRVLWQRKGVYGKFLRLNGWILRFLPNLKFKMPKEKLKFKIKNLPFRMIEEGRIEKFLRWLQLKYMAGKRTGERIETHRLLFHPEDKRKMIMKEYRERIREFST